MGVSAAMTGFPLMMWFFWVGHVYYDSQFPTPAPGQGFQEFVVDVFNKACEVCSSIGDEMELR